MESISETNSELKSQVIYLQEKLELSEQNEEEYRTKLKNQRETAEANDRLIATLKGEVSALKTLIESQPQISFRLNDLNVAKSEQEVLVKNPPKTCTSGSTPKEGEIGELKEKLLQTEEELAVFKGRYNQCSEECQNLTRRVSEMQTEHDSLAHQSKVVPLGYLIPIVIIFLAILIAFHPSS